MSTFQVEKSVLSTKQELENAGFVVTDDPSKMFFDAYQKLADGTAAYIEKGANIYYPTLGLNGEAGEIANKVKKIMRDNNGIITDEVRESLFYELGDVLWYISALATELKLNLSDIAAANLTKLYSRKNRGTISGSGDDR